MNYMCCMNEYSVVVLMIAIVLGAFISEDGATITAATLSATNLLDPRLAFFSAFAGLWAGDLGVYVLSRSLGPSLRRYRWFARWANEPDSEQVDQNRSDWNLGLAVSRFLPGMRLPAYVSAGFRCMPIQVFLTITALTAFAWVSLVFRVMRVVPSHTALLRHELEIASAAGLTLFVLLTILRKHAASVRGRISSVVQRVRRWEFWPAWIFYTPVVGFCVWFGIRYRGFALPTVANPSQKNGGVIGESKIEILRTLMETSPLQTADTFFIPSGDGESRAAKFQEICRANDIEFPLVLKPDTGQRGAGFKKLNSLADAIDYLGQVSAPLVLQRYVEGPKEAGVFYYRFPGAARGHIFGITRKDFPVVVGDGVRSLRDLIDADPRARLISHTYLRRFEKVANQVPKAGLNLRLVEAGNHCQGCIFLDGSDLLTDQLRQAFDETSRKLPGFYVGRYDIRYESDTELRAGRGFKIIELNGAASESTNIYDASNSIWSAYATLYRQWEIVYRIGAENRRRGKKVTGLWSVFRDCLAFSSRAAEFPVAD